MDYCSYLLIYRKNETFKKPFIEEKTEIRAKSYIFYCSSWSFQYRHSLDV